MRWFGEPWPSAERRAPVCEDDGDRMPVPVGSRCAYCEKDIEPDDRGVAIPFAIGSLAHQLFYHSKCFLGLLVGDALAGRLMP